MAKKRTKKQKRKTEKRRKNRVAVKLNEAGIPQVVAQEDEQQPKKLIQQKRKKVQKNKSTKMTKSQVSLIYKDLLKTAVVSLIVFILLLFIFVYMR